MERLKKKVLDKLLEIDCYNVAEKLDFISKNDKKLLNLFWQKP